MSTGRTALSVQNMEITQGTKLDYKNINRVFCCSELQKCLQAFAPPVLATSKEESCCCRRQFGRYALVRPSNTCYPPPTPQSPLM